MTVEQSLACRVATREVTLSVNMAAKLANMTAWSGVFTPTEYMQHSNEWIFSTAHYTSVKVRLPTRIYETVINSRSTTGSYYKWTSSKILF